MIVTPVSQWHRQVCSLDPCLTLIGSYVFSQYVCLWRLFSTTRCVSVEPRRRLQQAETLDHDWRPPPAAPSHQEHGLPEVLQHGAVSLHPIRPPGSAHHRLGCTGACTCKVGHLLNLIWKEFLWINLISSFFYISLCFTLWSRLS